ncbi:unnamed protein product [Gongylonema pulchrum]|uniref:I-set domain-containing protein n=1 Tax=Gongylonema pulchrum TaxID=637853 RepID=A0A183DLP7_9BILA|nr:unnamed protein product [Gongylonema pulchrum]
MQIVVTLEYKNGQEITPSDKAKPKTVNDKNYQLEIRDAEEDDGAEYKVVLSNDEGSADSSCALIVKLPPERPTIKKGIEDQFIPIGKPLEIAIEVFYYSFSNQFIKIKQQDLHQIN